MQGLGSLEVSLLPHRASFPELGESDSYYCLFTADNYYSFSAPLSGSVCTISPNIPWFNGTQMGKCILCTCTYIFDRIGKGSVLVKVFAIQHVHIY